MNVILKGQLNFLNRYFKVIGATTPFEDYFYEIQEREGIKLYQVDFYRKISLPKDLKALFQLIRIIKKEKPVLVHAQTPKANLLSMLASYLCQTPIRMVAVVGLPVKSKDTIIGKIIMLTDMLTYKCATHIYPNSIGLKNYLLEHFPMVKNKINIIGNGSSNGIDFNHFSSDSIEPELVSSLRQAIGLEQTDFVYAFLGRIVNDKGIRELIDAFLSFCDMPEHESARLLIIGPLRESDDPIPDDYQRLLREHPKIRYAGLQKDVRPYLMLSHAFVFPSYREGLPGSLIQAGAMGLPLLASRITGNIEIVERCGGLLFPAKNSRELASCMKEIYLNEGLRNHLRSTVRVKLKTVYDQEFYWECLKKEYEKLIIEISN